jgi:YHS domain-containing protein
MLRFLIFVILGYLLYRTLRGILTSRRVLKRDQGGGVINEMVQDPFCKTYIPKKESLKRRIAGQEFFFCSNECADKFEEEEKSKRNSVPGQNT